MDNNPFRKNPSPNVQQKVEDWGKTKFKPTKFGNIGNNYFKKDAADFGGNKSFNRKFNNRNGQHFHKNKKETYKFNEVSRDAKPENSTPWNKYKDEFVFKKREEEQAALQANMESCEAKTMLKQREINYRKSRIEQKKKEPTEWEDFGEEEICLQKKKKSNKVSTYGFSTKQIEKSHSKHFNKNQKLSAESKVEFKKKLPNRRHKANGNEFIAKELLDNFDSRKLSYEQNDQLRGVITKVAIIAAGGNSLESAVKNIRRKKLKKEK